jgi:hypothetical protein
MPPSRRLRVAVESNKALIRGFFGEVLNGGRVDVLDEVISTEYVEHAALSGQEGSGPEGVQQRLAIFRAAFPNLYWCLQDLIAN